MFWAELTERKQNVFNDQFVGSACRDDALRDPDYWRYLALLPPYYDELVRDARRFIQMGYEIAYKELSEAQEGSATPAPKVYKTGQYTVIVGDTHSTRPDKQGNTSTQIMKAPSNEPRPLVFDDIYELLIELFEVASGAPHLRKDLKLLSDLTLDEEISFDEPSLDNPANGDDKPGVDEPALAKVVEPEELEVTEVNEEVNEEPGVTEEPEETEVTTTSQPVGPLRRSRRQRRQQDSSNENL